MEIQKLCSDAGIVFLGWVRPPVKPAYLRYLGWLAKGKHAKLSYLENFKARESLDSILPDCKSVLVIGLPYFLAEENKNPGVAQYAQFADYHFLLKDRGEQVLAALKARNPELKGRVVVDSAPVLERALASKTFDGFIGKNTFYIHKTLGSYLLLGEILLDQLGDADERKPFESAIKTEGEGCGACKQCQVHCPTGALNHDYEIDSSKCLSYWTIEHRGLVPLKFWRWFEHYYFGCDICQKVCPYNIQLKEKTLPQAIPIRQYPELYEIATMGQSEYEKYFAGTPMTRAKKDGLRRNALIAMVVKKDPKLSEVLALCAKDPNEILRGTAQQAHEYLNQPI